MCNEVLVLSQHADVNCHTVCFRWAYNYCWKVGLKKNINDRCVGKTVLLLNVWSYTCENLFRQVFHSRYVLLRWPVLIHRLCYRQAANELFTLTCSCVPWSWVCEHSKVKLAIFRWFCDRNTMFVCVTLCVCVCMCVCVCVDFVTKASWPFLVGFVIETLFCCCWFCD